MHNYTISKASQISSWGTINAVDKMTTSTGNIVATARNITTSSGTITGKTGSFDTFAKTRTSTWTPITKPVDEYILV